MYFLLIIPFALFYKALTGAANALDKWEQARFKKRMNPPMRIYGKDGV